jgi:hypothetical protein
MPGAEAHIVVQSQNEILVMINYVTDVTWPIPMMVDA